MNNPPNKLKNINKTTLKDPIIRMILMEIIKKVTMIETPMPEVDTLINKISIKISMDLIMMNLKLITIHKYLKCLKNRKENLMI